MSAADTGNPAEVSRSRPREILYCGFAARAGSRGAGIGGLVSGSRAVVESARFDHTKPILSACTHPGEGSLLARFLEDRRRLARALAEHREAPAVVLQVAYYRSTWRELALARLARGAGRRLLLDVRGGSVLDFLDRDSDPFVRTAFRRLLRAADRVLVQCASVVPELERRYPRVRFEWFPNFVPRALCRADLPPPRSPGAPLRAVYFGAYSAAKGLPELLEAMRGLRSTKTPGVELHLAGAATNADLERRIRDARDSGVIDHGPLDPAPLRELLDQMDVFVFPTSHFGEGHSNAANEAMMRGLAIIATPHHENPRILPPETTRWLDRTRLVDSIRHELRFFAEHPDELARARAESLRWVCDQFTDERWIPFLERCLDEICEGSTSVVLKTP